MGLPDRVPQSAIPGVGGGEAIRDAEVTPFAAGDLEAVERYDRQCFPAPRRSFLERWLRQRGAHVLVNREGDVLRGYGMVRPARTGYRVGPLFADGAGRAAALLAGLAALVEVGAPLFIDIPQANPAAVRLVTARGMTPMFETARMYRGPAPVFAIEKVFGVTTLELG